MQPFLRRGLPLTVIVLALLGAVLLTLYVGAMVRQYADTSLSGALQGFQLALLPGAVLALLAVAAAAVLRTRLGVAVAGVVVAIALVGPAVAGEFSTRAKEAAQPMAAPCALETELAEGSIDPDSAADAARAQEALDALDHPVPFTGGSSSGVGGCTVSLATGDLPATLDFYRTELPSAGWAIVEDDDAHLRATRDELGLSVALDGEGAEVQLTVAVP